MTDFDIRRLDPGDVDAVDRLRKANAPTLGFLPREALLDYLEKGWVLGATCGDGALVAIVVGGRWLDGRPPVGERIRRYRSRKITVLGEIPSRRNRRRAFRLASNRLGAEAKRLEIDGLVTLSARHDGSNLPVFERRSLADPTLEGVLAMTYDPGTGTVTSSVQPTSE